MANNVMIMDSLQHSS